MSTQSVVVSANPSLVQQDREKWAPTPIPTHEVSSFSKDERLVYSCNPKLHSLIDACFGAFQNHMALKLSPDVVWATYLQSVAKHIANNAEKFRKKFVSHDDKLDLVVHDDSLRRNDTKEKWERIFLSFRKLMLSTDLKNSDLFDFKFSTSTQTTKIAGQLLLMDAMKEYYSYTTDTKCGIPYYIIEGTKDDWDMMIERVKTLKAEVAMPFADKTIKFLENFSKAFQGTYDLSFWNSFFKIKSQSGGDGISGNVHCLFPYLRDKLNFMLENDNAWPPGVSSFESIVNQCPMKWKYMGTDLSMLLNCGIIGNVVSETVIDGKKISCVTPRVHWYMTEGGKKCMTSTETTRKPQSKKLSQSKKKRIDYWVPDKEAEDDDEFFKPKKFTPPPKNVSDDDIGDPRDAYRYPYDV